MNCHPTKSAPRSVFRQTIWFWLWIVAFISGVIVAEREVADQMDFPLSPSVMHRVVAIMVLGLFLIVKLRRIPKILFRGPLLLLALFCFWQVLSSLWSVYPIWTLYRSLEYSVIYLLVLYTVVAFRDEAALKSWLDLIIGWALILLLTVWLGVLLWPEQAISYKPDALFPYVVSGIYPRLNSNSVSHLAAIVAIVGINRWLRGKRIRWLAVFTFSVLTMLIAQGRSGMLGFGVALVILLILQRRIGTASVLLLGSGFVLLLGGWAIFAEFFTRGQTTEVILALSGRLEKWQHTLEFVQESPLLGYGAYAGARFLIMPTLPSLQAITTAQATHSTWLELSANVGVVGVSLFLIATAGIWIGLLRKTTHFADPLNVITHEGIAILTVLVVRSVFTHVMVVHNDFMFFAAVGILAYLYLHRSRNVRWAINLSSPLSASRQV